MEKISHIVRGNSRVTSADVKSSSAVRPGALAFGRDTGTSSAAPEGEKALTTASKAATLQSQMADRRSSAQDRTVADIADQFFMSRIRRPEEPSVLQEPKAMGGAIKAQAKAIDPETTEELNLSGVAPDEMAQPSGYQPRGSFVDVQA